MTHYLRVAWHHNLVEEPVDLLSEIDDDGWEIRKVEVYRDGRADWADRSAATGRTMLSEARMPELAEIAAQVEFTPVVIKAEEFEAAWADARRSRSW
ncbi:DUF6881 domain-containing protein [Amycolatopsis sp. NBC_01480]|uniref:DUF6881 domain-containing protein n=1 Tax=Amycolatopsis sp. NBC_01480 TaxID=2903562 RepID=UPI002E2C6A95|nr:hypothetical protein [Amycolatopsis sp. NBC_01480]